MSIDTSPQDFDNLTAFEKQELLDWLAFNLYPVQSFNMRHTSYGMKQLVQHRDGSRFYVTDGQFKGGMLHLGFRVKDKSSFHWNFNISERSNLFRSE